MQVPEAENLCAPVERRRSVKYRLLASEEWKDDGRRKPNTHNEETRSLGVSPAKRDEDSRGLSLWRLLLLRSLRRRHDHSGARRTSRRGRRIRLLRLGRLLRLDWNGNWNRNTARTALPCIRWVARVVCRRRRSGLIVFNWLTVRTNQPGYARTLGYSLRRRDGRWLRTGLLR